MVLELVQAAVGFVLFLGAGYTVSRVGWPGADLVERSALTIALAFIIPVIAYLVLALALRIRVDIFFAWALALVVIVGSTAFEQWKGVRPRKSPLG